jgi:hypothetical protein
MKTAEDAEDTEKTWGNFSSSLPPEMLRSVLRALNVLLQLSSFYE